MQCCFSWKRTEAAHTLAQLLQGRFVWAEWIFAAHFSLVQYRSDFSKNKFCDDVWTLKWRSWPDSSVTFLLLRCQRGMTSAACPTVFLLQQLDPAKILYAWAVTIFSNYLSVLCVLSVYVRFNLLAPLLFQRVYALSFHVPPYDPPIILLRDSRLNLQLT